ncbi:hypothetical protein H0O01_03580 [Candidatus Micrarchaeota archaeon]|nr:hypothetical protein [Candidatus Micrarchaeota archaeon]
MKTTNQETRLIRGPKLEVLVPSHRKGVPFDEAIKMAEQGRRVLASNERISRALMGSREWRSISDAFLCWTGTITGYEQPRRSFGAAIEYMDPKSGKRWVFPVPKEFRGEEGCILVAEHPDYTLENDGRNVVVQARRVDIVRGFPEYDKVLRLGDARHDIPHGGDNRVSGEMDPDARRLVRIDSSWVGPIARNKHEFAGDYSFERDVYLSFPPSTCLGAVVESQSARLRMRRMDWELTVEGTPEQLDAAMKLLKELNGV